MATRFALRTLSPPGGAALDPKQGSPVADNLRLILNAPAIIVGKAPGLGTRRRSARRFGLIVNLEQPAPYFPQVLSHSAAYPIYSDASARSHDPATWVSDGAYVLAAWSPTRRSHSPRILTIGIESTVHIPRVEYDVASDGNVQFTRYRAGIARPDRQRPGEHGRRAAARAFDGVRHRPVSRDRLLRI